MATSGFLAAGGWRLEYAWHGPAPAETATLVLLHEGLGCLGLWRYVPAALSQLTGLGVLAYSRAGYGGSEPRPLPWPGDFMEDEAYRVLPDVLRAAGVERPILVGHSDGASIALLYAARPPEGSPAPLGLALMSPHVFTEPVTLASIRAVMRIYQTSGLRNRLARHHGGNVDIAFHGWSGAWTSGAFDSWSIEHRLGGIAAPSLVIQGLDDEYGTLEQIERLTMASGGPVERLLLENCAHGPHVDRREATLAAIAGFARGLI